ncbi:hypothetical protein ANCDUO_22584, partial [Ancylostoma duodenale]
TWALRKQDENAVSVVERSFERVMLGITRLTQDRYDALRVPRTDRIHWTTLARERDKWKDYWRPLSIPEDQRESRPRSKVRNGLIPYQREGYLTMERKERYVESIHSRVLSEWIRIINIPNGMRKEFDSVLEELITGLGLFLRTKIKARYQEQGIKPIDVKIRKAKLAEVGTYAGLQKGGWVRSGEERSTSLMKIPKDEATAALSIPVIAKNRYKR